MTIKVIAPPKKHFQDEDRGGNPCISMVLSPLLRNAK
jgi:hypothetical protein